MNESRDSSRSGRMRTDWENVNLGCMFVCMNNTINSIMRMIEDDGQLSEKLFDDDDLEVLSETLALIDTKREKLHEMLFKMFNEDREIRSSQTEDIKEEKSEDIKEEKSEDIKEEKSEDEYRIMDDDEAIKEVIIALCKRKK